MAGTPAASSTPAAAGTGGMFSASTNKGFFAKLKKAYSWYTGGFIVFVILLAIAEQMGLPRVWIGYIFLLATVGLYAGIGIIARTSDAAEYYVAGQARAGVLQRHGDRRRLDERRVVHRYGRNALPHRVQRPRVRDGLDRRLLPGGAVPRAVPAQVRPVHDSRLPRRPLRRPHSESGRHLRGDPVLVHVRGRADLRRRPHHDAAHRRPVRVRHLPGTERHSGVLVPRRDARSDVDAGRAVHHPDRRVHDPGCLAVREADRRPDPADRLWPAAPEGDGARGKIHQRPEGNRGPGHLQGACGRGGSQAQERRNGVCRRQGGGRCGRREGEGGERAARSADPPREDARRLPRGRRCRQGRLDQGGGTRRARGAAASPRRGVPGQGRARTRHRRAAISSRSCSA